MNFSWTPCIYPIFLASHNKLRYVCKNHGTQNDIYLYPWYSLKVIDTFSVLEYVERVILHTTCRASYVNLLWHRHKMDTEIGNIYDPWCRLLNVPVSKKIYIGSSTSQLFYSYECKQSLTACLLTFCQPIRS